MTLSKIENECRLQGLRKACDFSFLAFISATQWEIPFAGNITKSSDIFYEFIEF